MIPFGDFKVVLLDEADYLSPNAQAALRGVMEEYHTTARFILTCNYPNRIIPALHSRCQGFHIERVDVAEFTARVATILMEENVEFDLDTLDTFVKATYPDLRKCINTVQMNSLEGKLHTPEKGDTGEQDYKIEMVELFKKGKISEARKLVCGQARPEEMEEIYRWLYDNITIFGEETLQEKAILIIKQGLVDHTLVSDPEINLAACLIRLSHIQ
jgi:DNA polymerase III delta prime subunit